MKIRRSTIAPLMSSSRTASFLALAVLASIGAAFAPLRAQTIATVHIGMIPIEPAALVYYAKENGFFTKAGLDVVIDQNPSTPALAAAVLSGTYDIAYATIPTLAQAHSKGLPFVVIAPGMSESARHFGGAIMVAATSTVKTAADLNGKTFGTAGLNTIAEYLPRAWLDHSGGNSTTVKFIEIPFPLTIDAIVAGRIDAAYLTEPFVTIAEQKHLLRQVATGDDAIAPGEFVDTGWYTTTQWAKDHPDVVVRFRRAMSEAAAWADANPDKVVAILAKDFKLDPALIAQTRRVFFPERINATQAQPWIDVTSKYAKFAPFRAEEMIDPGALRAGP